MNELEFRKRCIIDPNDSHPDFRKALESDEYRRLQAECAGFDDKLASVRRMQSGAGQTEELLGALFQITSQAQRASEIIRDASHIGVGVCYCRHKMQHLGRACDAPMNICMTFNGSAESLTWHGHARRIEAAECRDLLAEAPGVVVLDEHKDGGYPTAVTEGANNDPVYVGRIREDISHPRGLDLWVVADNVRKGAALNSIQIAEILVKNYL